MLALQTQKIHRDNRFLKIRQVLDAQYEGKRPICDQMSDFFESMSDFSSLVRHEMTKRIVGIRCDHSDRDERKRPQERRRYGSERNKRDTERDATLEWQRLPCP